MPIYEYQCNACGHQHEALQKLGAEPLLICPVCNEAELKKKISAAGFRLKGAGWYETDFKSGNKKNVAGESSSSSGSSAGGCSGSCTSHSH
ncbi:MAG: zinc ribbon domain-containing protein [Methylomonas lenta]|nr:zinc ribbon domain-containing protein [Methylomonas lenta]